MTETDMSCNIALQALTNSGLCNVPPIDLPNKQNRIILQYQDGIEHSLKEDSEVALR